MSSDTPPIPRELLPPGWGAVEFCEKRFVYRHRRPLIELVADRTPANRSHPGLGLSRCWELRYRYALADRFVAETIGCVSTRRAATEGVLECMKHLHGYLDESTDPSEVRTVLEGVSLEDFVPARLSSR